MTDPDRAALVVVLEDDRGAAKALAALLDDWGYECVYGDRLESIAGRVAPRSHEVRAIISDDHLQGGTTGVDAVAGLLEIGVAAPALLLTGALAGKARRVRSAGGFHYMEKPVAPRRLKAWLDTIDRGPGPA